MKFTDAQTEKFFLNLAKISLLIISIPATWYMVSLVYPDKVGESLFIQAGIIILKLAGIFMIEGAFMYFWQKVQTNRNAQNTQDTQQYTYVAAAWIMFALLVIVGLIHGEGLVALVLRFVIALLLFITTNDKLSYMRNKVNEALYKGERRTRKVMEAQKQADERIQLAVISRATTMQLEMVNGSPVIADRIQGVAEAQMQTALLQQTHRHTLNAGQKSVPTSGVIEGIILSETQSTDPDTQNTVPASQPAQRDGVVYAQRSTGQWAWCCDVCSVCSDSQSQRKPKTYSTQLAANKAYGGHAGGASHTQKLLTYTQDAETVQTADTQSTDDYALYTESDGQWHWECGLCKQHSVALFNTQAEAETNYAVHATDYKHTGNTGVVEEVVQGASYSLDGEDSGVEVTFSR
jgi:hypothetical protein